MTRSYFIGGAATVLSRRGSGGSRACGHGRDARGHTYPDEIAKCVF